MPYVKLDCGILDSTLWIDRDQREVFLTALLMASPVEFSTEVQQLRVDSIEWTGFKAPAGWYGMVEAAGPGIVRRALVDPDHGMAALHALGEPDHQSRSQKHEGRRLIRIDGGFLVLNFMDYRDRDYTMAERAKRYRARKKADQPSQQKSTPSHRDFVTSRRDITQSESESESESERTKNPSARKRANADEEPEGFAEFRQLYPPRAGSQPWTRAVRAWRARVAEGAQVADILAGTRRYAKYIAATGKERTEMVLQAATFLGPDRHYQNLYAAPKAPESAWDEIQRLNGGQNHAGRVFEAEPGRAALAAPLGAVRRGGSETEVRPDPANGMDFLARLPLR